ncbi:hypothetical protein HBH98_084720 [Parastagonospora nodorum]|uniref:Uncharacterized protein n=1 Tax=Phaeosphaeria nodorum (strain SN15 / ATCC MYA-4574 / FGSC 10173) TaxID=321614 RepID=A0A7U2FDE1_PHANO|nr:hypothetical protein HBI02_154610 [Parastagonospora nodorum]QRD03227.1 hypothetical protein JI435_099970 [Parastagonospora nodorum SN15]KAH4301108.1 hypothetical protein HBI01_103140 [Parastagonospora nodorum]KAH4347740.1 hypothetical protein HBH98_084720 [Parastagonospora nodorum]KAH4365766.1 hypothetical protein HBH94_155160 [Parastagonospora nodorum]
MLNGDPIHKQVLAATIGTAAEAGDSKAVRKCMLILLEGRGALCHGISKEQFAVYVIEKKLTLPVDTAKFRLVLLNDPHFTLNWCIVLLYGEEIVLKGEESSDASNSWNGLLKASGWYIHTRLLD